MKTLQALFIVIALSITSTIFSQTKSPKIERFEIHEIGITVNSLDDLKTIDWDDFFSVFELDEINSKITFFIELKDVDVQDKSNNDVHFSQFKFTVSGYESEKDELQKQMSSITEKLLKNYKS
jgi:hypothetical protein